MKMTSSIYQALSMKIDMSKKAITNRLKTVNQVRKVCLLLANSSARAEIRKQAVNKQQEN